MSFWTTSSRGVTPWGTSGTNPSTLSEWPRSRRVRSPPSPPPSPSYTCPSLETRVMGTEWRIPRYLHSFFFLFILPLILFSDKYLLIFFYLILSYLQKKIWLKEIFHIFYSSKRIFYNEQWNSTDISLVFKSVSKYSCLVIIPSCRHQSQSRIFSLQISGCRVHTTHTCSSLPDAESSRLLRISSGKARLKLRSPYTETPGPCWKACICECMVNREWQGVKVFISCYQLFPAWSTFQLIYNLNS